MNTKVGLSLCLKGTSMRIMGSRMCNVEKNMIMIISPALPIFEINRSEDFEECRITDNIGRITKVVAPFFRKFFTTISSKPYVIVEPDIALHFANTINRISEIENKHCNSETDKEINEQLILLLKQMLLLEVVQIMANGNSDNVKPMSHGEDIFIKFLELVVKHYASRRNVAEYAADLKLSPRYFSNIIIQYTGQRPMYWITTFTIGQAKHLLLQSELQIKEIADQLGFPEQFTFRKYFKTHTGMSPTEYRKLESKKQQQSDNY